MPGLASGQASGVQQAGSKQAFDSGGEAVYEAQIAPAQETR